MKEFSINIGEVKTVDHPVTLTCFGLGSCIGLFVQDRVTGISGGAHILLPDEDEAVANTMSAWYNVGQAVDQLLNQFKLQGSLLQTLRAKVVGGANVMDTTFNVGQHNIESVTNSLVKRKIYIAAMDVGGTMSRTARFNTQNGDLLVRTQNNFYKVL